ncbi:TetR/AcrR family transcriptional regulator [Streptomyces sp. NPDC026672]|uniref:TetR/AcrR family transcriptional regulator n=1 Tax=unclassified Streptomyces TaxID=2593676 RepID=UPI003411331B
MTRRDDQRRATEARIVEAAVESLIERGYAATTAQGVQHRIGISRGALLHHFPTREALSAAAVRRLVELNLRAVREEHESAADTGDAIARGVLVLYRASRRPSFATELELWAASRADVELREALRATERAALRELDALIDEIFGPGVTGRPGYRTMVSLTVQFLRGLTISGTMRRHREDDEIVREWTTLMNRLLDDADTGPDPAVHKADPPA